jgi:hypothetical protein
VETPSPGLKSNTNDETGVSGQVYYAVKIFI